MRILFLCISLILTACSSKQKYDPLSEKWAGYISRTEESVNGYGKTERIQRAEKLRKTGRLLHNRRKYKSALKQYQAALQLHATGILYFNYADTLSNLRLKDSVKAYKIALTLKPDNPHLVLYNLACAYSRLKDSKSAYRRLKEAVRKGYSALSYVLRDPDLAFLRKQKQWADFYSALVKTAGDAFLNTGTPRQIFKKYYLGKRLAYFFMSNFNKKEYRFFPDGKYKIYGGGHFHESGEYVLKNKTIRLKSDRGGYLGMWREIPWKPVSPNKIKLDNTQHDIIH